MMSYEERDPHEQKTFCDVCQSWRYSPFNCGRDDCEWDKPSTVPASTGDTWSAPLRTMPRMKTLDERIQEYADRKRAGDWKAAHDFLIEFALATLEARQKGGTKTGNRPQQEKHLARARKVRTK